MTDDTQCALCRQARPLCDSHIIPEFMYSLLYDDKHRFFGYSTLGGQQTKPYQKGFREPLLCRECEGRFGRSEDYAKRILDGGIEIEIREFPGGYSTFVDYKKFKLFSMSLLWRAGVASRSEFSQVFLGPHLESLREMLIADDPGPYWKYGFTLNYPPDKQAIEVFSKAIVMPETIRIGAHRGHRFILGASIWTFYASSHMRDIDSRLFSLNEDGRLSYRSGGRALTNLLVKIAGNFAKNAAG